MNLERSVSPMETIKIQVERIKILNQILAEDMEAHLITLDNHQKFLNEKPRDWDNCPTYPHGKAKVIRILLMIRQETIKLETLLNGVM